MAAAGSASVGALIARPVRPGVILAAFPTAVYLRTFDGSVIALLTRDATRIPCGLVLAVPSAVTPLDRVCGPVLVGGGQVRIGAMGVRMTRTIPCGAPEGVTADPDQLARTAVELAAVGFDEHDPGLVDILRSGRADATAAHLAGSLIGAGSGLTPSGDDLLAGFLVGAISFGVPVERLREAVLAHPAGATTDLSSALLGYAARGESTPEVSAFVLALSSVRSDAVPALGDLLRVGHTSGVALATGVHSAGVASLGATPPGNAAVELGPQRRPESSPESAGGRMQEVARGRR